MSLDEDQASRVPKLTQYCYRFISSHLDSIQSLGDTPYSLCEPILRSCSAAQLLVLEKNSPYLKKDDQAVWRSLCSRDFPRSEIFQHGNNPFPEPACWRKQYFVCCANEEKRLEAVGTRIRSKRDEADQEKRERQVVYTDRLPPAKRSRFYAGPGKPKTLFEKTRAESLKVQRLIYGPSMLPPMSAKTVKPRPVSPPKPSRAKVMVNTPVNKLPTSDSSATVSTTMPSTSLPPIKPVVPPSTGGHGAPKKDPMSTLFMPKHRAYSQLPTESYSMRRN